MRWCSRARVVALSLSLSLIALAACKQEGERVPDLPPRGPVVDVARLRAPALFEHIPADTPYVVASFEAVPLAYYAKLERALGPALARTTDQLRALGGDRDLERWLDAVIDELAGKWSAKGLESLGLSARPRFAIYGHGALPAVGRLEIRDGKALLATIERIAHRAGATLPPLESRHGREFWRIELPGDHGAIVALTGDQLVAALGPRHAIADVLPQILGAEKPRRSMAGGDALKQVIARHRLGPLLVGFADAGRLAHALFALAERTPPAACAAAIDRIAAQAPRLVFGYGELTDRRYSGAAILELAPPLIEELKALRTAVPGLAAALAGEPMLAMGGGLDLARGWTAAQAVAAAVRDLGRACEAGELVRAADELREAVSAPLAGPLARLVGGAVSIDAIDFAGRGRRAFGPPIPRSVEGFAALAIGDAGAAYRELAGDLPPLRDIEPDGDLHALPLTKLGLPFDVHGGVGKDVLVVAAGARGQRQARAALAAGGGGKAPFFAGTLDLGKVMALQAQIDPPDRSSPTRDLDESMAAMFGRTTISLDVTDAGLALWLSGDLK